MRINTVYFIAKRLLFSKQKKTAVSIISWIAVIGMVVSTAAMIILLSAFNGIERMIVGIYTEFDQEVVVSPIMDMKISEEDFRPLMAEVAKMKGYYNKSYYLRERVILRKKKKWANAELWAVQPSFYTMSSMLKKDHLINGHPITNESSALIGVGLAGKLALNSMELNAENIVVYIPRQDRKIRLGKTPFYQEPMVVNGAIDYNPEINEQTLIADINFLKPYYDGKINGVLIATSVKYREEIAEKLKAKFGKKFLVRTNLEKNELIFKTSRSEKLIVIIILIFVFILSLFNLSASLTMTFLEKRTQLTSMKAMGLGEDELKKVFWSLGTIIVLIGVSIGLISGVILVKAHQIFDLIKVPGTKITFPSELNFGQGLAMVFLLILLGFCITWFTTTFLMKNTRGRE